MYFTLVAHQAPIFGHRSASRRIDWSFGVCEGRHEETRRGKGNVHDSGCLASADVPPGSAEETMAAPAAASRQDEELTELLTKLYSMQEDIGAKPKTSEEEKKGKAANIAVMGKGKKAAAKGTRFLELKSTIVDRLKNIHQLLKETKSKEEAGYGGDNAKDIIKLQAEVREHLRQAGDEWNEMDAIYKKEARKKKSKFTAEELEVQSELVRRLHQEIEKIKEAQMRGYSKNRDGGAAVSLNTSSIYKDTGGYSRIVISQCTRQIQRSFVGGNRRRRRCGHYGRPEATDSSARRTRRRF